MGESLYVADPMCSFSQQLGDLHARYDSLLLAKEKLEREFKSLRS